MSKWYILDNNHKPVISTAVESSKWMEDNPNRKRVAYDELTDLNGDDVRISTVFLGLDHGWGDSIRPTLWETMIFGGVNDQNYQERYTSYQDALEGHQKAINFIKTGYNGNTE
jgi:hypothetical protein